MRRAWSGEPASPYTIRRPDSAPAIVFGELRGVALFIGQALTDWRDESCGGFISSRNVGREALAAAHIIDRFDCLFGSQKFAKSLEGQRVREIGAVKTQPGRCSMPARMCLHGIGKKCHMGQRLNPYSPGITHIQVYHPGTTHQRANIDPNRAP